MGGLSQKLLPGIKYILKISYLFCVCVERERGTCTIDRCMTQKLVEKVKVVCAAMGIFVVLHFPSDASLR